MQTLNVGTAQTDKEREASEELQRNELREDSQRDAYYFFWAAGLAAVGSGLLPLRLNILVNIGAFDLLHLYSRQLGQTYPLALYGTVTLWLGALVALGFAARSGRRWAFLAGLVLYGADMIILVSLFSIGSFGVHAFFVFRWFQGQKALADLKS